MNYPKIIANFLLAFFTSMLAVGVSIGMTQEALLIAFLNAFLTAGLSAAVEMNKQADGKQGKIGKTVSLGLVV